MERPADIIDDFLRKNENIQYSVPELQKIFNLSQGIVKNAFDCLLSRHTSGFIGGLKNNRRTIKYDRSIELECEKLIGE